MPKLTYDIGASLTRLRRERGLTQAQMAELIGTHRTSYSKMESGQQEAPVRGIINLAEEFGLTVDEVLGHAPASGLAALEPSAADVVLAERLRLVDELDDDDRSVLLKLIDTFVSKKRFKTFVQEHIGAL